MLIRKKLLAILIILLTALIAQTPSLALDPPTKIAIFILDTANYKNPETNNLIISKFKSKYKFPYYTIIPTEDILAQNIIKIKPNKDTLRTLAQSSSADIVIAIEIVKIRNMLVSTALAEEIYDNTDIILNCLFYQVQSDKYLESQLTRSKIEPASVASGVSPLIEECLEEFWQKILKI